MHLTQNWEVRKPGAASKGGIVAAQSHAAATVGADILAAGGTAVDAAVAAALAGAAAEPWSSGLGGIVSGQPGAFSPDRIIHARGRHDRCYEYIGIVDFWARDQATLYLRCSHNGKERRTRGIRRAVAINIHCDYDVRSHRAGHPHRHDGSHTTVDEFPLVVPYGKKHPRNGGGGSRDLTSVP